jgi:hypothetical protein
MTNRGSTGQCNIFTVQDHAVAKKRQELWAEALRDIGILLFVFAPLDTLFRAGHGTALDWGMAAGVAFVGLLLLAMEVRMVPDR